MRVIDLTGQRFGKWTVLSRAPSQGRNGAWLCRCACGAESRVRTDNLVRSKSTECVTCGYIAIRKYRGDLLFIRDTKDYGHPLYPEWCAIVKDRNAPSRWLDRADNDGFSNFIEDAGAKEPLRNLRPRKKRARQEEEQCLLNRLRISQTS